MSTPLNILYFRGENPSSSKFIRVLEPLQLLEKRGHKITSIDSLGGDQKNVPWPALEKALSECNIFLISNVDIAPSTLEVFEKMVAYCNQHKKLVIYDLDDFYDQIPDHVPMKKHVPPWDFFKRVIGLSHVLTVTGKELQQALAPYHPRILILPNMLELKRYPPRARQSGKIRIGWVGGVSHLGDLALFTDSIRNLQKKYHFEFVVFGMFSQFNEMLKNSASIIKNKIKPEELQDEFHGALVQFVHLMDGIKYQPRHVALYHQFPDVISQLDMDIGLCPLQDNLFNRCRSALKFYQYAAVQTATIASNVYPYSEEPVMLVENNTESWTKAIEAMIVDKKLREESARLQYEYVANNRNYAVNGTLWETTYQSLIDHLCR